MFDVHFLVNSSRETTLSFFYDQTGRSQPGGADPPSAEHLKLSVSYNMLSDEGR